MSFLTQIVGKELAAKATQLIKSDVSVQNSSSSSTTNVPPNAGTGTGYVPPITPNVPDDLEAIFERDNEPEMYAALGIKQLRNRKDYSKYER